MSGKLSAEMEIHKNRFLIRFDPLKGCSDVGVIEYSAGFSPGRGLTLTSEAVTCSTCVNMNAVSAGKIPGEI
jgi:hypothetical protein